MKKATAKQEAGKQEVEKPKVAQQAATKQEPLKQETVSPEVVKQVTSKQVPSKKLKAATAESTIRILKRGTCPSLTGKSKLGYQIGVDTKGEVQLRVCANSGGGMFSDEFVSLNAIQELFAKVPADKPITSFLLFSLYKGKSANTPGFLFAALKQEGMVQAGKDKKRGYERGDPKKFMAEVKALMASKVDLKGDDTGEKAEVQPQKAEAQGEKAEAQKIKAQPTPAAIIKKTAAKTTSKKSSKKA